MTSRVDPHRSHLVDILSKDRGESCQPPDLVRTLPDSELIERCMRGFGKLKEIIPYLREARKRFAKPGRRVPVAGQPTWTEWVEKSLGVTIRTVQRLLSEKSPHDKTSLGSRKSGSRPEQSHKPDLRSEMRTISRHLRVAAKSFKRIHDFSKQEKQEVMFLNREGRPRRSKTSLELEVLCGEVVSGCHELFPPAQPPLPKTVKELVLLMEPQLDSVFAAVPESARQGRIAKLLEVINERYVAATVGNAERRAA
ncbi:MAG: hypothetical protein ABSE82_09325 [Nitrososphaerales archaeon]